MACSPNSRNVECRPITATAPSPDAVSSPFHGSVFTIVMENKSARDIFKSSQAPYIRSLAQEYAVAAGYTDAFVHPSEPNYLWMVAGQNFDIRSDHDPDKNHVACTAHLADQIEMAGLEWKSYQESMGEPCGVKSKYPYAAKHNPFVYFDDINGWNGEQFTRPQRCIERVVDYAQFDKDLAAGTLPKYVFITPNMVNDMHDGSIAEGDAWLQREIPKILDSPAWKNGGVLFLTWDEGSQLKDGQIYQDDPPMIVISPLAKKGFVSTRVYDTSSFLKTVQSILGVEALPCEPQPDTIETMDDLFTVPLPKPATPIADRFQRQ